MRVFEDALSVDPALRGAVLTVGNFDGVHLGHQRILRTARALATVSSGAVIAMTFEPHPLAVLNPKRAPARLTPWEEKAHQLGKAGADAVVRLATDQALLSLAAEDFVRDVLVKQIHPSYIVEGPSFAFGRGRQGDTETLRRMSARGGFQVHVVAPYKLNLCDTDEQAVVSSTRIRQCLLAGNVAEAAACLGRPYSLFGQIVHGAGDGKKLGYPTINLDIGKQLVPAEGVYAGAAVIDGHRRAAAVSIGCRPTLGGQSLVVEAFCLDDSGDWYGRDVRLELLSFVRAQQRFESREALTAQITRDIKMVRQVVASADGSGD